MRFLLLALFALTSLQAAPPAKRILFVGNSYTGQIKKAITGLVASSPHKAAHLEFITPGGRTLQQHLQNPKTLERISMGQWDFVVLQDQSQTPALNPDGFLKSSAKLHRAITKSGARTVYYETWGRRDGDQRNLRQFPTFLSMQKALSNAYRKAAKRDDALLCPVGTAWQEVRRDHPALGSALYAKDGSHPSAKGALLAAACFYKTLFNDNPATLSFAHGLPEEEALLLRSIAAQAK
jgi:hypothetical protein